MDILIVLSLVVSGFALLVAGAALYLAIQARRQAHALPAAHSDERKNALFSEIANMLSDGSVVWQRLVVQCDELSANLSTSMLQGNTRETIGDWLQKLRDFSKQSKTEIDHAYQLFATEAKKMSSEELDLQLPDMDRFDKEMKSNVAVISDQLSHLRAVLRGGEPLGGRQFKITLHKPQVMPHFLRKRQKMAELQRRRTAG